MHAFRVPGETRMLAIHDGGRHFDRRAFLTIGGLALGGLSLMDLLAAQTRAASDKQLVTDKSVIFLFLHGGPSQTETFEPKLPAQAEIRSAPGETSAGAVILGSHVSVWLGPPCRKRKMTD